MHSTKWIVKRLVNLSATLVGGLLVIVGVVLISLSQLIPQTTAEVVHAIVLEMGTAMFGIGLLAVAWDLAAKRAFLHEVLDATKMSATLEQAGIQTIAADYLHDIDWKELLRNSDRLDLFFAYAHTWRNNLAPELEAFGRQKKKKIRVVLPNPNDPRVLTELAHRFNYDQAEVERKIKESAQFFLDLAAATPKGASVACRYTSACPLLSMYVFDNQAVLTVYSHQKKRVWVPTFLLLKGKSMYTFLEAEFECLYEQGISSAQPTPAGPTP